MIGGTGRPESAQRDATNFAINVPKRYLNQPLISQLF